MARIALMHVGLKGHLGPASRLGARLVRRGHEVHAWAPEAARAAVAPLSTVFHPHEPVPVSRIAGGATGFAAALTLATAEHAEALIEELLRLDVELVIHDVQALWGRVAADFLGLPRAVSYPLFPPAALTSLQLAAPRRQLVASHPPGWQESMASFEAARAEIVRRWGVHVGEWPEAMDSSGPLTISYSVPELVGDAALPRGWRLVGPLLDSAPPPGPPRPRPYVYVSLGTFFNFALDVYRTVIAALAGAPVDALITTGGGSVSPADLGPLPANIDAVEFAPARDVLARSDMAITHCGINSVHEALVAGVPMVCLPQAHDQFAWAARVAQLGAGRIPADETPESLREAVLELLEAPEPRLRAAEMGRLIEDYDGESVAAEVIDEALGGTLTPA